MLWQLSHSSKVILALAVSFTTISMAFSQDIDIVADDLSTALGIYSKALDDAKSFVFSEIDKKIKAAQNSGDLKLYERLEGEKNKFILESTVPSSCDTKQYESSIRKARSEIEEAYLAAIKSYTKDGQIEKARMIQAEFDVFRKPKDAQGKVTTFRNQWSHNDGYFVRGAGGDWFEKWGNGKHLPNLFTEVQTNDKFIELKHYLFPVSARLYADHVMIRDSLKGQKEFTKTYDGTWVEMKSR